MTDVPVAASPEIDLTKRVAQFIAIRDKMAEIKKRHEEELQPLMSARTALEGFFGEQLNRMGVVSMRTEAGTVSATERKSATVEDMEAFRGWLVAEQEWEIADLRANAPKVAAYAEEHHVLPPGIKYSSMYSISVRRA
jgi:hypothetical protein